MRSAFSRFCALLGLSLALVPSVGRADTETASDLVAKNLAARGGAARLAAIGTIRFTGKMIDPGDFELSYVETRRRNGGAALYQESIEGLTLTQGFDGSAGWRINPFEGRRDAERMSADDMKALADDATIDGTLLTASARHGNVAYLGREDFEGTQTYKLRATAPSGAEYVYYLDPDTYLEIEIVETRDLRGAKQVQAIQYGDYELVGGVYFPFSIESGPPNGSSSDDQKLVIDRAVANVDVPGSLFSMPVAPAK